MQVRETDGWNDHCHPAKSEVLRDTVAVDANLQCSVPHPQLIGYHALQSEGVILLILFPNLLQPAQTLAI